MLLEERRRRRRRKRSMTTTWERGNATEKTRTNPPSLSLYTAMQRLKKCRRWRLFFWQNSFNLCCARATWAFQKH
jgi:hypothetical protein